MMERVSKKVTKQIPSYNKERIVFFHPDLGIGGAERLVIDAAVGLQDKGHKITIFTSHCDPKHCFDEARDGTLDVRVRGDSCFPATILGRLKILFSILRQLHLLCAITWSGELKRLNPSVFLLDQLSANIPFLRWFWEDVKILFYCHFPDLLLVQGRKSWYKRIWRVGFDWLEGWGIRGADRVVVNSQFTKGVVENIWKGLGGGDGVSVVYPCVNTQLLEEDMDNEESPKSWKDKKCILSINRFELKKNVALAIKAFAGLKSSEREGVRLVVAGGCDMQVTENLACLCVLESLATSLNLRFARFKNLVSAHAVPSDIEVLFLLSVPAKLKHALLEKADLLIYTPPDEHFGIVPLEAMLAGVPVLAANSGGPLETVQDPETGWLRDVAEVEQWTDVMRQVLHEIPEATLKQMGANGKHRVKQDFSEDKMAQRFEQEIEATLKSRRGEATELGDVAVGLVLISGALASMIYVIYEALRTDLPTVVTETQHIFLGVGVLVAAIVVIVMVVYKLMQNESGFR